LISCSSFSSRAGAGRIRAVGFGPVNLFSVLVEFPASVSAVVAGIEGVARSSSWGFPCPLRLFFRLWSAAPRFGLFVLLRYLVVYLSRRSSSPREERSEFCSSSLSCKISLRCLCRWTISDSLCFDRASYKRIHFSVCDSSCSQAEEKLCALLANLFVLLL
jgi:hypothetical protein